MATQELGGRNQDLGVKVVKLARDLTRPIGPPNGGLVRGIPLISGKSTPPETNMAPKNRYLEKEFPIGNHHLKVPC